MSEQYDLGPMKHHLARLLQQREHPKTICPSEAARALSSTELSQSGAASWRDLMPIIRQEVFRMRDNGELEILQKGQVLSNELGYEDISGPIRLRAVT